MRQDDFPPKVKRLLAARAGHRCSVCLKPTSGPAVLTNVALSDGVAAHITAASLNGPRFDSTLSPAARRSAANGIWVCTQCAREIDADISRFSVEVLQGLKTIREESAYRELQQHKGTEDQSGLLIELPYATTIYKLFEVIAPQAYTFPTTSALRDVLRNAEKPSRLLDLAPEVIIGTWESHPNVAGILSTLLSNNVDYWKPTSVVLEELERICEAVFKAGEWTRSGLVEPSGFRYSGTGPS